MTRLPATERGQLLRSPPTSPQVEQATSSLVFEDVYQDLFPFVWRTARRMGVSAGYLDDVCQETFVVVHRRLSEFEGRSSLRTWVFRILLNVVQVHRRTLRRKSAAHRANGELVDPDELVDPAAQQHEHANLADKARLARLLLDQLDEDKRVVLVLADLRCPSARSPKAWA